MKILRDTAFVAPILLALGYHSVATAGVQEPPSALCGVSSTRLVAGQSIDIGTVQVTQQATELCISFGITRDDWYLTETHVAIAATAAELPQNDAENPQIGNFPYHHTGLHSQFDQHCVDYAELGFEPGQRIAIAAHAVVQREDGGTVVQHETGWGEGPAFPGCGWAMYFEHLIQDCPLEPGPEPTCAWRTQTNYDWGATCSDDEPTACYRDGRFYNAFPHGFEIGCADRKVLLTSPSVIELHLPSSGEPAPFTASDTRRYWLSGDPLHDPVIANDLFGQTVALALNIGFDRVKEYPSDDDIALADMVIADEANPCHGMTIAEIYAQANNVLGSCQSELSAIDISVCVATVNAMFLDGECPAEIPQVIVGIEKTPIVLIQTANTLNPHLVLGGGGCSAGGSPSGGAAILLIVCLLHGWTRRRRLA